MVSKIKDGAFDGQFAGAAAAAYVGTGEALLIQGIDLAATRVVGEPVEIGGPVRAASNLMSFTASAAGTVSYLVGRTMPPSLVVDRNGVVMDTIGQVGGLAVPGNRPGSLALGGNAGLFRYDVSRGTATLLHSTPGLGVPALDWSPDDARLAFSNWCTLMVIDREGGGLHRAVEPPERECLRVTDWYDSDRVIATRFPPGRSSEVWEYRVSDGVGSPLVTTRSNAADGTVAPNGLHLAYASDVGGTFNV